MKHLSLLIIVSISCIAFADTTDIYTRARVKCTDFAAKNNIQGYADYHVDEDNNIFCTILIEKGPVRVIPKPKFKVGDCIRQFDSYDFRILELMPSIGEYGYTLDIDCTDKIYCNQSNAARYEIIDGNSVKIECPAAKKHK